MDVPRVKLDSLLDCFKTRQRYLFKTGQC